MRKTTFLLISLLIILAVMTPARVPSRSSERPSTPPVPLNVTGTVQYNGFNLQICDGSVGECPDLQAICGDFIYKRITIGVVEGKSQYSADVPGDESDTQDKEGCVANDPITFTIKGEVPEQPVIYWSDGGYITNHNLAIGSPNLVFLPMVRR